MSTRHLFLVCFGALALSGLAGCATLPGDSIDDEALYRAQDRAFRPMGSE